MMSVCDQLSMLDQSPPAPELMVRMMDRMAVNWKMAGRIDGGLAWYAARAKCIFCRLEGECRSWLNDSETLPEFCPNAKFFGLCAEDYVHGSHMHTWNSEPQATADRLESPSYYPQGGILRPPNKRDVDRQKRRLLIIRARKEKKLKESAKRRKSAVLHEDKPVLPDVAREAPARQAQNGLIQRVGMRSG